MSKSKKKAAEAPEAEQPEAPEAEQPEAPEAPSAPSAVKKAIEPEQVVTVRGTSVGGVKKFTKSEYDEYQRNQSK